MGCCFSRSAGLNSPYPGGGHNASARAINPPHLSLPESVQSTNQDSQPRRRHRDQRPLDQHINKPLRRHTWAAKDRRWTKIQLAQERADFFDTRVTGRAEVWQTVHAALQVLWASPAQSQSTQRTEDDGLATAQTILTAAEISLPTGDLANGVYDSLGNFYQFPEWVVADPENVIEDDADGKGELSMGADDTVAEEDGTEADQLKSDRGKAVVDARDQITLRARLSEDGRDVQITASRLDNVKVLVRMIAKEAALPPTKKVRMAYMGKILKDGATLEAQGWQAGHIVNALVFDLR